MKTLHAQLDEIVAARRTDGNASATNQTPGAAAGDGGMLGALTAAGLSTETVRDELIAFLFAGFDSTATALSCTIGLLAANPEIQAALAAALDGMGGDDSLADARLADCALLDAVVRESLRLYPPQYLLFREPVTDVSLDGSRLPAGTTVVLAPWLYHRDGRFWDTPEAFRPRRWLDDTTDDRTASLGRQQASDSGWSTSATQRPASAYIPYGVGPRRCIGRRMANRLIRRVVAAVCRRRRLVSTDTLTVSAGPTLSLDDGLTVDVHPR